MSRGADVYHGLGPWCSAMTRRGEQCRRRVQHDGQRCPTHAGLPASEGSLVERVEVLEGQVAELRASIARLDHRTIGSMMIGGMR